MCLGGLERIVGSLKSVYASEASYCVLSNLVNASEVSDREEFSSKEISLTAFACASKVPEGLGIDDF